MPDLEMLPCPFCGRPAGHYTHQSESLWSHNTVDYHHIGCPNCDFDMIQCDGFDEVLAVWNTRAVIAPVPNYQI